MSVGLNKQLSPALRARIRAQVQAELGSAGVPPRSEGGAMSRRQLLRAGGAMGASLAAASFAFRLPMARANPSLPSVAVVGAGLAGVTAAYRLAQVGIPVKLYEASNRVGGRCWTARGFAQGQIGEHGGEFIDSRHVHLRGLAQELGLQLDDFFDAQGNPPVWPCRINNTWYAQSSFDAEFETLTEAIIQEAINIGAVSGEELDDTAYSWGTATYRAKQLDQKSMRQWMDQRLPGMSSTTFGKLCERLIGGGIGLPSTQASAISWFDFLGEDGGDERYRVRGGNDQVPQLAAAALPAGALKLNAPLQWLRKKANGTYEMRFGGITPTVSADLVILALPFSTLRNVDLGNAGFTPHRMEVIQELGMGTNAKLLLQYNDRPAAHTIPVDSWTGNSADYDAGYQSWDSTSRQSGSNSILTLFYGGQGAPSWSGKPAHAAASGSLVSQAVAHVNAVVPGTGSHFTGQAWLDAWVNDPWTRGSYSAYKVGQYTQNWRFDYLPEGGVHFAGEHTSTYSRAYLNGGVESGQRAAIEIMQGAGVTVPPAIANLPYSTD